MASSPGPRFGITRRGFLLGAAAGLATGIPLTLLGRRFAELLPTLTPVSPDASTRRSGRDPSDVMPGRYPGRVIEVRDPHAVSPDNVIDKKAVASMVDRGMAELVGTDPRDVRDTWRVLFEKDDVVGIKVNPVGRRPLPGEGRNPRAVESISSFPLVVKVVRCLQEAGVPSKNIIVFERYADEFCRTGYKDLVERELPGVRWMASAVSYSNYQLDVRGFDPDCEKMAPEVERNVTGYDPDVFTTMGYCLPEHSPRDDRRFRSHLSVIVSRLISKMINLPVLKDHRSAGVTLALKNMSHGMNNNVARSHLAGIAHGFGPAGKVLGPNQCNTFIPQAVSHHRLRQKATLHILDGLIGVYEGGPGSWNRTWGTWRHKGLFFATDPVAMDHVCWDIIDRKRAEEGWAPVERMGWLSQTDSTQSTSSVTALAANHPLAGLTLAAASGNVMEGRYSESFNLRQPEHVILAGQLGLGVFDREKITYHLVETSRESSVG
jgi:hypothetical protein